MQKRHFDRYQYFRELANTSREFYLDYLSAYTTLGRSTRVLEVGCGEGGNLLPFAERGCQVVGIDICEQRIQQAEAYFHQSGHQGVFLCQDFLAAECPASESERFDVVLVHDVIEHIEPPRKTGFFLHIRAFVKHGGVVFFGFPAWQNPFGGHQQIATGWVSKMPFVHLLPRPVFRSLLRMSGNDAFTVNELMSIRRSRMSVERFEQLCSSTGFSVLRRTLWLVNPHYQQKFHLRPRRLWPFFACLRYVRNFYTTSAFYLLHKYSDLVEISAI